jgi:hypothetical protein
MIAHTVCVSTSSIVSNTPASKNASTFWSSKNHATSPAGRFKIFSRCADSHAPTAFTASTRALTGSEGDFAVRSHLASPVGPAFAFGSAGASGVARFFAFGKTNGLDFFFRCFSFFAISGLDPPGVCFSESSNASIAPSSSSFASSAHPRRK